MAAAKSPFTVTLARLAAKACLTLRVAGKGKGQIVVRATPDAREDRKAAVDGEATRVRVLETTSGSGEEARDVLRFMLGLLKRTGVTGEGMKLPSIRAQLLGTDEEPVAAEERRALCHISTLIVSDQARARKQQSKEGETKRADGKTKEQGN